jgi:hypothetical protein
MHSAVCNIKTRVKGVFLASPATVLAVARIPLIDPDDPATPPEVAAVLHGSTPPGGGLFNVVRALANNLDAFGVLGAISKLYQSQRLSDAQHELAYLTASVVNDCHY